MKKQILNVSLLVATSATIIAVWALPKQGAEEEGLYLKDHKEEVLQEEEKGDKKDSTKTLKENGKEEKDHTTQNRKSDTKKNVETEDKIEETQKKAKSRLVKKTVIKTDTVGKDIKIEKIEWADYGRGMKFRKVAKEDLAQPDPSSESVVADSTL